MALVDGVNAVLENEKTPQELEKSLSKEYGEDDFYLEKERKYRSEEDIFVYYSEEEREKLFGKDISVKNQEYPAPKIQI